MMKCSKIHVGIAAADHAECDLALLQDVSAEHVGPLTDDGQLQMATPVNSTVELVAVSAADSCGVSEVSGTHMLTRADVEPLDSGNTSLTLLAGHVGDSGSAPQFTTVRKYDLGTAGNCSPSDCENQFTQGTAKLDGSAANRKTADKRKGHQDTVLVDRYCTDSAVLSQDDYDVLSEQAASGRLKTPAKKNKKCSN
jgi:hypothetical protein